MGQFRNYPAKTFNSNQNFLARDPSGSGDVIRVNAQGILDAAVAEITLLGGQVLGIDTKTEALATDIALGVYVLTGGDVSLFDGSDGIFRVSDSGTGGDAMANGNELVLLVDAAQVAINTANIATNTAQLAINTPQVIINKAQSEANKVSCTASFSSSVYTVTYDINPTIWPTLEAGLIIDFPLSTTANTGAVSINHNGTVDSLRWLDGSLMTADDLDADFTKRVICRFDGTNWVIISDVAGLNGTVNWTKYANGDQKESKILTGLGPIDSLVSAPMYASGSIDLGNAVLSYSSGFFVTIMSSNASNNHSWASHFEAAAAPDLGICVLFRVASNPATDFKLVVNVTGRWY